jgi:hypothetical protein
MYCHDFTRMVQTASFLDFLDAEHVFDRRERFSMNRRGPVLVDGCHMRWYTIAFVLREIVLGIFEV